MCICYTIYDVCTLSVLISCHWQRYLLSINNCIYYVYHGEKAITCGNDELCTYRFVAERETNAQSEDTSSMMLLPRTSNIRKIRAQRSRHDTVENDWNRQQDRCHYESNRPELKRRSYGVRSCLVHGRKVMPKSRTLCQNCIGTQSQRKKIAMSAASVREPHGVHVALDIMHTEGSLLRSCECKQRMLLWICSWVSRTLPVVAVRSIHHYDAMMLKYELLHVTLSCFMFYVCLSCLFYVHSPYAFSPFALRCNHDIHINFCCRDIGREAY